MSVIPFGDKSPTIDPSAFLAPDAWVIGDVRIAGRASIFFNVVIRGDIQPISIGAGTNIQEHVLVHTSHGMSPVSIGENVTVGHRAIIHGCTIGVRSLIGMGATILDNAVIGDECIIGAHSLIPKGVTIPSRSLVMGTPGRIVRQITEQEAHDLQISAQNYQDLGATYRRYFSQGTASDRN
jgi:carbonic anhydrase/acetyltransferase-like protein (isoleucine patch superfamily)